MRSKIIFLLIAVFIAAIGFYSCDHNNYEDLYNNPSGFPKPVSNIIVTRCAVSGCHNTASYQNAGGLLLDSWEHLFRGGSNGAVVIPYSPENSSLLYFINTHADLGIVAEPTMPLNESPLTTDEYLLIRDWVASGSPNAKGEIPFALNAETRQKIYLTMQSCDKVAVIDAASRLVMRYIPVGKFPAIESPHCVRVSKDGKYAYVSFLAGEYVQKIDTKTDTIVGEAWIGAGAWNVLHIAPDGKRLLVSDWEENGKLVFVNTETMEKELPEVTGSFKLPHGIAGNAEFTKFYVTSESENVIYKFSFQPLKFDKISIGSGLTTKAVTHEIIMAPDFSKYFITCQALNEVRVMDAVSDTLIKIIPVGTWPQEFAMSKSKPYLFVSCMEDEDTDPGYKGSVYAINYNNYDVVKIKGPFYQPHGLTVDDENNTLLVASRNATTTGPAPHHSSDCGGRNGYYDVYDLNSFQKLPGRYEVLSNPYSADTRFK